ncbi:hypothetical protein RN22_19430 [Grimontia sp. AD028]|uniref:hypothetical protein n=1 Tax=Grimontia sp. AD028 TaxID=1581149 RepID=UPI00061B2C4E|nr:hypothetical protein [Grimontia sp. AD028]KKD58772.1 hypothetical protein RN22_19430 [Grimontia sp. AD028]
MKLLVIIFFTLFLASGCKITSIEGETDDVEIKVNSKDNDDYGDKGDKDGHPDGKFCPPGQAKKGRC